MIADLQRKSSLAYVSLPFMISYCVTFVGGAAEYVLLSIPLLYHYFVGQYKATKEIPLKNPLANPKLADAISSVSSVA
jgi:hypothetical protein